MKYEMDILNMGPRFEAESTASEAEREMPPSDADTTPSRWVGIPIDQCTGLSRMIDSTLALVYGYGGVVYGGCVRDMLRGIAPADIDIIMPVGPLDRFISALRGSSTVEVRRVAGSFIFTGTRVRIMMEPLGSTVYTNAAMLVLDICVPFVANDDTLSSMPPDYDVNMLYFTEISGPYEAGDVHVGDACLETGWCKAEMRTGGRPGVSYAEIKGALFGGIATIRHKCVAESDDDPFGARHLSCGPEMRLKIRNRMQVAGFVDATDYTICTNINCRLCGIGPLAENTKKAVEVISSNNFDLWTNSVDSAIEMVIRPAIETRIDTVLQHCPLPLSAGKCALIDHVLMAMGVEWIAKSLLPRPPSVIHVVEVHDIADYVIARRTMDRGAVLPTCDVDGYIELCKRQIHNIAKKIARGKVDAIIRKKLAHARADTDTV